MKKSYALSSLCFLLLMGCGHLNTPKVPGVAIPQTEFRAKLVGFRGDQEDVEISTRRQRFRLHRKGKIFLGDLQPKGEVWILSAEARTFFHYTPQRESELFKSHGRPGATRYRDAVNASGVKVIDEVLAAFMSPCQAASRFSTHQGCEHTDSGPHLQSWTHTSYRRTDLRAGYKEVPITRHHSYDTSLGVLVAPSDSICLAHPETVSFDEGTFQVPPDYQELLSDKELRDPRFQYVGTPNMLPGRTMEGFMMFALDFPPPPDRPKWFYQQEKWWSHETKQKQVYIERAWARAPFDPHQVPFNVEYKFVVKKWDEKPEVGQLSWRESPRSLVFYGDHQLFRVSVSHPKLEKRLLPLCRSLLKRCHPEG